MASSKSERVFSVAGNLVTQKRACLAPEKVKACVIVKSNLGRLRDMGFRNNWEVNVSLIGWFLLASPNQCPCWNVAEKTKVLKSDFWISRSDQRSHNRLLWLMKWVESLRIQSFKCFWKSQKILGLDFWESRDWDFEKIPGSRDIPGSRRGLIPTINAYLHLVHLQGWNKSGSAACISLLIVEEDYTY